MGKRKGGGGLGGEGRGKAHPSLQGGGRGGRHAKGHAPHFFTHGPRRHASRGGYGGGPGRGANPWPPGRAGGVTVAYGKDGESSKRFTAKAKRRIEGGFLLAVWRLGVEFCPS